MGIFDGFDRGEEMLAFFDELDDAFDEYFSESGERRRFIYACRKLTEADLFLLQSVMNQSVSREEMIQQTPAADNPLRLAHALLLLETTLAKTKDKLLLTFVFELLKRPRVFKGVNRSMFPGWELELLRNPRLAGDQIQLIWDKQKMLYIEDMEPSWQLGLIIKQRECPVGILEELYDFDDPTVRKYVGLHKKIPSKAIQFYLNSPRKPERLNMARNRYVPAEVLLSLMGDKYPEIIETAKGNFQKRFPDLSCDQKAIDQAIEKNIEKPFVKSAKKPVRKFDPYEAEELGADYVCSLKKAAERKKVAEISNDLDILSALSHDKSVAVRRTVANFYRCPENVLKELAGDADAQVSNKAFLNLARQQEDITIEDVFCEDVLVEMYESLNRNIKDNSDTSMYSEEWNSSQGETELVRLQMIARYTSNHMLQLRIVKDLDEIPDSDTIRWQLLSSVSCNRYLSDTVNRRIVLELGFGNETVMANCKTLAIFEEFLSQEGIPNGVRGRIERRYKILLHN